MRRRRTMIETKRKIAFAALFLVAHIYAAEGQPFDYDKNAPVDLKEELAAVRDGIRVSFVNYANPKGGRTYGMLVLPARIKGKTAAIVWTHSNGFYSQLPDAMLMARDGAISLLLELSASTENGDAARLEMLRSVISLRRGVDILTARPDVDPQRIGLVGHSYGAMMGTVAAAVDKRFKAAVFEVGLLGMSIHIRTSPHPWAESVRAEKGDKLEEFRRSSHSMRAITWGTWLPPRCCFNPLGWISVFRIRTRKRSSMRRVNRNN